MIICCSLTELTLFSSIVIYPGGLLHDEAPRPSDTNILTEPWKMEVVPDSTSRSRRVYRTRLDSGKKQIRLLTLLPGDWDSPIRVKLSDACLSEGPDYAALSYAWGDPNVTTDINLEGFDWPVTTNLEKALRHLRLEHEERILWTDALCINQGDVAEKSAQVTMMGGTFASAQNVIVWLGEADATSDAVLDFVNRGDIELHITNRIRFWHERFREFGRRAWFKRVWVLQEIVLSRSDPQVLSGMRQAAWSALAEAWATVYNAHFERTGYPVGKESVPTAIGGFDTIRKHYKGAPLELNRLMVWTRDLLTSDPSDKIYAVRALLHEELQDAIHVDYSKATWHVFAQAMVLMMHREGLWALEDYGIHCGSSTVESLPSWTIDFATPNPYQREACARWSFLAQPAITMRGASGNYRDSDNGRVSSDWRRLSVTCLLLDVIQDHFVFGHAEPTLIAQLAEAEELASSAGQNRSAETSPLKDLRRYALREPMWRAACGNKNALGSWNPAPHSYSRLYQILRSLDPRRGIKRQFRESTNGLNSPEVSERELQSYRTIMRIKLSGRTCFNTTNGLFGIAGPDVSAGDVVCVCFGLRVVLIIRPPKMHGGQHYKLIAAAYVAGIMDGEIMRDYYETGLIEAQEITLE